MLKMIMSSLLVLFSVSISTYCTSVTDDIACPLRPGTAATCNENEVYYESKCDESICGNDPMCKEYHRIANKLNRGCNSVLPYSIRNVTELSRNRLNKKISYITSNGRYVDYIHNDDCHQNRELFDELGNLQKFRANSSSFSPWEYVINIDENRIPREILETKCRCQLCLNSDRTDTTERYLTNPLMVTRYFHLIGNGSTVFNAEFSYGCVCQYNNNV